MSYVFNAQYFPKASPDLEFQKQFKPVLVKSIEQLKEIIANNVDKKIIAFDTETTGLSFFKDHIVGFSWSYNKIDGYYVPLRHLPEKIFAPYSALDQIRIEFNSETEQNEIIYPTPENMIYEINHNLPLEALYYFYQEELLKKQVLMFNAIFDCMMLLNESCFIEKVKKYIPNENSFSKTEPIYSGDTIIAFSERESGRYEEEIVYHKTNQYLTTTPVYNEEDPTKIDSYTWDLKFEEFMDKFENEELTVNPFKIRFWDVMALVYEAHSDSLEKGLKPSTLHYLGRTSPSFEDTLKQKAIIDADHLEKTTASILNKELTEFINQNLFLIENKPELPAINPELTPVELKAYNKEIKSIEKEFKNKLKALEKEISAKKKSLKTVLKTIDKLRTDKPKYVNFQDLTPEQGYAYASADTANTYGLFFVLYKKMKQECEITIELLSKERISIMELDNKLVKAMMFYQLQEIYIDNVKMQALCIELTTKAQKLQNQIYEFFGYPLNLDCLVPDTKITISIDNEIKTVNLIEIQELIKNPSLRISGPTGFQECISFFSVGTKETYKIYFQTDRSTFDWQADNFIECSANELFLTKQEDSYLFKRAKDLIVGNLIFDKEDYLNLSLLQAALYDI